nr:TSUP family transporter [Promicromonospora thailandica]
MLLLLLVLAILFGGALQRVAGMGFGLVAGPFIVLLLGAREGVLFVNAVGAVMALVVLWRMLSGVDWRRYAWLVAASVSTSVPAAFLMRDASPATLEIVVGLVVVVAMTLALVTNRLRGARRPFPEHARWPLLVTGVASGFGSVAAGIGGPPLAVYSVLDRWDPRAFAATAQPFFMTNAVAAVVAKVTVADVVLPPLAWWAWLVVGAALFGGVWWASCWPAGSRRAPPGGYWWRSPTWAAWRP